MGLSTVGDHVTKPDDITRVGIISPNETADNSKAVARDSKVFTHECDEQQSSEFSSSNRADTKSCLEPHDHVCTETLPQHSSSVDEVSYRAWRDIFFAVSVSIFLCITGVFRWSGFCHGTGPSKQITRVREFNGAGSTIHPECVIRSAARFVRDREQEKIAVVKAAQEHALTREYAAKKLLAAVTQFSADPELRSKSTEKALFAEAPHNTHLLKPSR